MSNSDLNRRDFIKSAALIGATFPFLMGCRGNALAQQTPQNAADLELIKKNARTGENWTGAIDAPETVSWKASLAKDSDEGERMVISGTVFQADGKTPAPAVLIYLYHTNVRGVYGRGNEPLHGKHRGWMLTGADGRYEFSSIRPASYPDSTIPQHVHMTLTGKIRREDSVDSILFADDKFVTAETRRELTGRGGFDPILKMEKGANGIWLGSRDIMI
jgi:protocatechuate 3,4-dioxygenase beta subunit